MNVCSRIVSGVTYGIEDTGTIIVVQVGIQVIHANSVDTENLHESCIPHTLVLVAERILSFLGVVSSTTTGLVGHANNLESLASLGIHKVVSLDLERSDSSNPSDRGREGHKGGFELYHGQKLIDNMVVICFLSAMPVSHGH